MPCLHRSNQNVSISIPIPLTARNYCALDFNWQVRNIYRYRAKGGVYRKKEDFARLYGLTVKDYRRLEPYIRISEDYLPASTLVGNARRTSFSSGTSFPSSTSNYKKDSLRYPVKIREGSMWY